MTEPLVPHPKLINDFESVGLKYNEYAQRYRGDDFVGYLASIIHDPVLLEDLSAMHQYQLTLETNLREILANKS